MHLPPGDRSSSHSNGINILNFPDCEDSEARAEEGVAVRRSGAGGVGNPRMATRGEHDVRGGRIQYIYTVTV